MTVPLAWGTYAPVVRYVYEMDPPVPGLVFSAGYYIVAAASLVGLNAVMPQAKGEGAGAGAAENGYGGGDGSAGVFDGEADGSAGVGSADSPGGEGGGASDAPSLPVRGGLELGSYLFLGNCLQVVGLKTVPADRAAFLVQLTTIMVPIVQAWFEGDVKAISVRTWIACLLAFGGVVVMGYDGKDIGPLVDGGGPSPPSALSSALGTVSGGDLLVVSSAFLYTLHVVRLGRYARYATPLRLAASKAVTESVLTVGLVSALLWVGDGAIGGGGVGVGGGGGAPRFLEEMGREVSTFFSSLGESIESGTLTAESALPAVGACLWTGWVTCAYTIYAQSYGQSRVGPTDSNLIYSAQPVFSAMFAYALLGETLGPAGYGGGALIAAALGLIATAETGGRGEDGGGDDGVDGGRSDVFAAGAEGTVQAEASAVGREEAVTAVE